MRPPTANGDAPSTTAMTMVAYREADAMVGRPEAGEHGLLQLAQGPAALRRSTRYEP